MRDKDTITEADLNAYVDGELTPERRAAVEAHLEIGRAACRERV